MENLILQRSERLKSQLVSWRRYFHRYPELSFQEKNTSNFIEQQLREIGITNIETKIGGYGIVASIKGEEGPVIALRADIDALPIYEKTGLDYASSNPGVMHACGHDAHSAMLLGAAKLLFEDASVGHLKGTVKLIFQLAEEAVDEYGLTGAPYVLQSGAIDDVVAAAALHVCPWREVGEIQVNKGESMANIDNFVLTVNGTGGHGGYPHQGKDPIWLASFVLQGIYSLISRCVNPLDVGTISVGEISGGQTANVIPNSVKLTGTIRSYTREVRQQLKEELEKVASIVNGLGGNYVLEIEKGEPALYNDEKITEIMIDAAKSLFPRLNVYEQPFGMGGEDFGFISEKIPSTMAFLGCKLHGELHNPEFQLDEEVLPIGTAILTNSAYQLLDYFGGDDQLL